MTRKIQKKFQILPLHVQFHAIQVLLAHRGRFIFRISRQILQQRTISRSLVAVLPLRDLMDRCIDSQLIQQLVETDFCWTFERLLFVLADLAKKNSKLKVFPNWKHVDDAGQLHHELRSRIKGILARRVEDVDWPQVDELDMIRSGKGKALIAIRQRLMVQLTWQSLTCSDGGSGDTSRHSFAFSKCR